jgi:glucose/arabinose dehydrogenase
MPYPLSRPVTCLAMAPAAVLSALGLLSGCSDPSQLPERADQGAKPTLPTASTGRMPTVNIAPAVGWANGQAPKAAAGLSVSAFASGFDHPRWLHVLPNGDVLVAETNAPPRPEGAQGVKGWVMKLVMSRAGAGVPSANRISLLRDADGDGSAETRTVLLEGLNSPFGMALVADQLYVAHTDAVMVYAYAEGQTKITSAGRKLTDLPSGPRNHHWTKSLIGSADGKKLYATVGSNSNVAEHGMAVEEGRAAIWEIDRASGAKRLFATGLRNPNGMAWTTDGVLWTVVNERDELGSDLVPDYLTSVKDGGFYGWPYSWYGDHTDPRVQPQRPDLVATAVIPDYALGNHVAPLGLAAATPGPLSRAMALNSDLSVQAGAAPPVTGMFVGLHGSWNREPRSGYKVVYVGFNNGKPTGLPVDVLTGFLNPQGKAMGRPVGVSMDPTGGLLVADDVGNTIWRVTANATPSATR